MIELRTRELEVGMQVMKELISSDGAVLLPKGSILTATAIKHMPTWGIEYVVISADSLPQSRVTQRQNNPHIGVANTIRTEFKKAYAAAERDEKISLEAFEEVMKSLIDSVVGDGNILKKVRSIKAYDEYTYKHSVNVSMLSTIIGKWLNYSDHDLRQLAYAGLFHDIGKSRVSKAIINKPGKLTAKEKESMDKHPRHGYEIVRKIEGLSPEVAEAVLQHHEREDGTGYPNGLNGGKINRFAKIIAVCDIFDAMTSDRPYKKRQSPFETAEYLSKNSYGQLDPRISKLFFDNLAKFYVGNEVELNTGQEGSVIFVHRDQPTRPIVKVGDLYVDLLSRKDLCIVNVL